jgi:CPA2 family monovalent cation:H+ antiporter-2
MDASFIISFGIIIISATVVTYIFNRLKQPSVLAFILTGLLIGPLVLGWVDNTNEIMLLSEIGIAFLLFSVGVGTDIRQLKKINVSIFLVPIINIILTFIFTMLFRTIVSINLIQAIYLSFIVSFSSTMLVVKLLMDDYQTTSMHGRLAIGILLAEDLIAVLAIPILQDISNFSLSLLASVFLKGFILVTLAFILNKVVYPTIIKNSYKSEQSFFLLSIASCFIFILVSHLLSFPIAIGAFFGGVAISIFPYNLKVSNNISGIRNLLTMIFFVSLGMQLSFNISAQIPLIILILFLLYILKPVTHFLFILFSGYGTIISSRVSLDLLQVSEFSLILAMQALNYSQITQDQYSSIILMASISMLLTPYLMKSNKQINRFLEPLFSKFKKKTYFRKVKQFTKIKKDIKDHIIIIGSDFIGEAMMKVIARDIDTPMLIVDYNPDKILPLLKNKKANVICGDINYDEVINSLNIPKAQLAIITLPSFDTTVRFIKTAKSINPNMKVYTRAKNKKEASQLYKLGADLVILPQVLESNYLLEKINIYLKYGHKKVSSLKSVYLSYLEKDIKDQNEKQI